MIKQLICGKKTTKRADFLWNMSGSMMYAVSSLLLTYISIRMIGEYEGGAFAFALTIAQLLANLVYYETRNYQVTDTERKYSFGDYHTVKIINAALMMLLAVFFVAVRGYNTFKAHLIVLVCFYRMLDGYADGYESHFHANGRLDLAGKSMTFRALLSLSVFFLVLHYTEDAVISMIAAIIAAVTGILVFDVWIFDTVDQITVSVDKQKIAGIIKACFPLFAGMFLWTYILSASRIAVDTVLDDSAQAYYQILFMPISVINLFATFILKPNLTTLSELYAVRNPLFIKKVLKLFAEIIVFTAVCIVVAFYLGVPVLKLLSGLDIAQYKMMFVFLIFAGGINALGYVLYSILLIFRQSGTIMATYASASILTFVISDRMTAAWGLWGASASYLVAASFIMLSFSISVAIRFVRRDGANS